MSDTSSSAAALPRKPLPQRLAEHFMVLALAGMVVAVFVNVVLRYVFSTSIVSYEEISRLLFVWLVAVGTIVAAFEGKHLGFDMLTSRLKGRARKLLFWFSQALVAGGMLLLLKGSWEQVIAGMESYSTVLGYPLALGAAATLVLAVGLLAGVVVDLSRGEPLAHGSDADVSVE
ncbi:TRAP transporter small permease [Alicycliphilus denitrificans]|uniref:TRAP transporter small permease protein n=2 Tax=Alicycliphilus denitrificans TaxID=179636 RepID=F4G5V3_ALIDK|nr:TRAP transporter small permease [Alicycliphilus denitrificans]ADV00389.1 Tripartite ATP-independent periplasmic transporter DctQ component [Alicycliphilus denitrificans BC]AEB85360.1 Tripartite ATP-independent periplasmic transporter DctQ component [Alicycliphilus denitrificans K601]QKD43830.1 TRAP transporter small permease [Alicycliphilus denitrificans]GAO22877.1 TRAP dicarboxylate transporter subunit DctQ [Alicycliphilus sp. B1]